MKFNLMTVYWLIIWFGLGFGIPEGIALATGHPENTLSDQVWHIEGLGNGESSSLFANPISWNLGHWVIFCGMVWLFGHFIDHIWH